MWEVLQMTELISAGFTRLFKNKVLWLLCAVMFAIGIFTTFKTDTDFPLNKVFFLYAALIGIASSVFITLFTGTEYSDGCVRNKLVVGHGRASVYLSNLIINSLAVLILCLANIIPTCAIGIPRLGLLVDETKLSLLLIAASFLLALAYSAVFTLLSMLITNKAYSAVICIILAGILLFTGAVINSRLNEPEFYEGYSYTLNGQQFSEETEPNPNYISGNLRKFVEALFDILPSGQATQINTQEAENPGLFMAYSAAIIIVTTGFGLILFRKKDLK